MTRIINNIQNRWRREGGYRQVLTLAVPLILSTGSIAILHFVDRVFLTWYSQDAVAASMPAGILNFAVLSLFIGTASYVGTFVAQYYGAEKYDKIGSAVWQGVYIAFIGALVLLALIPLAPSIFHFVGHAEAVQKNEIIFFQILCLGALPVIASSALSGFFSGQGKTWPVMFVDVVMTATTIVLDYLLIFGRHGLPRLGIAGAGIATVIAGCLGLIVYLILIARPHYNRKFHVFRNWRFNPPMFWRLLRFGFPSGIQFFIDVAGFALFILFVGRLGTTNLAASNIAFNINTLSFMPMIGIGIAVSVLVGQSLGKNRPDLAETSVYAGFHLTILYMGTIALLYVLTPNLFLAPFAAEADPKEFAEIKKIATVLLRFVALYSIFDTMNIIFASAIKGAGDTRYVMCMIAVVSGCVLVIPSYLVLIVGKAGIYAAWTIATLYVIILGFAFLRRFLSGKWKSMRVIEAVTPAVPPILPEAPFDVEPLR